MESIYAQILLLGNKPQLSKHEQFVQGFTNAILINALNIGSRLPSINKCILRLGFARETVSSGYKELIKRGIVRSENKIGFFVASTEVRKYLKVALILTAPCNAYELFYSSFRAGLNKEIFVDQYFHQDKIEILADLIAHVIGMYSFYVVVPILHHKTATILGQIPMDRFLMIDRFIVIPGNYAFIVQTFDKAVYYHVFMELFKSIQLFKGGFVYYHKLGSCTPPVFWQAFRKFVRDTGIKCMFLPKYVAGSVRSGRVYYIADEHELWIMVKDCKDQGLIIGKDVGILSVNDDPIKELICNGITTCSTDFKLMAEMAASFIATNKCIRAVIPAVLKRRCSI